MNQQQIKSKVRYTISKANKMFDLNLKTPRVEFFTRGSVAGWADLDSNTVAYNEKLASINKRGFKSIVIHEVAHIVTDVMFPRKYHHHCKEFKMIDTVLGGSGTTYHNLKTSK